MTKEGIKLLNVTDTKLQQFIHVMPCSKSSTLHDKHHLDNQAANHLF